MSLLSSGVSMAHWVSTRDLHFCQSFSCLVAVPLMSFLYLLAPPRQISQGPRSNFEIGRRGGGGTISDSILGGPTNTFLLILYNFTSIGGGGARVPPAPLLRGPCLRHVILGTPLSHFPCGIHLSANLTRLLFGVLKT